MFIKKNHLNKAALALSLLAISTSLELFAAERGKHCEENRGKQWDRKQATGVRPAQANFQDEALLLPVIDQPIPFSVKNFNTNVSVNFERSVFEVRVPGLYALDSFLLVTVPNIGDTVAGYITINNRKLLTFYSQEVTTLSSIVEFHFNDRLVYLEKGYKVSVVLSEFAPGTTVLARGFVMVALNNSHEGCSH